MSDTMRNETNTKESPSLTNFENKVRNGFKKEQVLGSAHLYTHMDIDQNGKTRSFEDDRYRDVHMRGGLTKDEHQQMLSFMEGVDHSSPKTGELSIIIAKPENVNIVGRD